MFTKINKLVISQYDSAVPEAKLRRHYRVARSVIYRFDDIRELLSNFVDAA